MFRARNIPICPTQHISPSYKFLHIRPTTCPHSCPHTRIPSILNIQNAQHRSRRIPAPTCLHPLHSVNSERPTSFPPHTSSHPYPHSFHSVNSERSISFPPHTSSHMPASAPFCKFRTLNIVSRDPHRAALRAFRARENLRCFAGLRTILD
jgi:hypothetical protein